MNKEIILGVVLILIVGVGGYVAIHFERKRTVTTVTSNTTGGVLPAIAQIVSIF